MRQGGSRTYKTEERQKNTWQTQTKQELVENNGKLRPKAITNKHKSRVMIQNLGGHTKSIQFYNVINK